MSENEETATTPKKKRRKKKGKKKRTKKVAKRDPNKKAKKTSKKKAKKKTSKREKQGVPAWVKTHNHAFGIGDRERTPSRPEYTESRMKTSVTGEHNKIIARMAKELGMEKKEALDRVVHAGLCRLRTLAYSNA
ncbi:hypothetical protein LCGC14_0672890 [marine sediment metagenome]|uniref:Uncharacterized protein n=1 Tax=marine sediment metagenome TaxID=412755 RepID=A0A0F9QVJ5_9ZZZZ